MNNAAASDKRTASDPTLSSPPALSGVGALSTTGAAPDKKTRTRRRRAWLPALLAFASSGLATALAGWWLSGSRVLADVQGGWIEGGIMWGGWVTTGFLVFLVAVRAVVALSSLALCRPLGKFSLHRPGRIVAVLSGLGLTLYGVGFVVYGVLTLLGLVGQGPVDVAQTIWSTAVWHLWEAVTGILLLLAAHRTRGGQEAPAPAITAS